jgi:heme/copper-type cytochrome/quinol oxidase subunit 2
MPNTESERKPALTSRRGFVLGASLSIVTVYGVWAAYDAAPLDFSGGKAKEPADPHAGHGAARPEPPDPAHAGHGAPAGGRAETIAKFRGEAEAFVKRYQQADGSVAVLPASAGQGHESHGAAGAALDVYLLAQRWSFEPGTIRLAKGQRYRFRMMAADVAHGASIQAGRGAVMVRLRPGVAVDREIAFLSAGRYLVYCTTYCGAAHDRMYATIVVA